MTEDKRLEEVADTLEIRNLIAHIAHSADEEELDDYGTLFTDDAVWGGGGQPLRRGRTEILEGARDRRQKGLAGPGVASQHVVTTTWLEIEGALARGRTGYQFYVETDTQSPRLAAIGTYQDTFRKTDQGWKLAERLLAGNAQDLATRTR